jgi:hypothetical protein
MIFTERGLTITKIFDLEKSPVDDTHKVLLDQKDNTVSGLHNNRFFFVGGSSFKIHLLTCVTCVSYSRIVFEIFSLKALHTWFGRYVKCC